jgi:hypothetical protein
MSWKDRQMAKALASVTHQVERMGDMAKQMRDLEQELADAKASYERHVSRHNQFLKKYLDLSLMTEEEARIAEEAERQEAGEEEPEPEPEDEGDEGDEGEGDEGDDDEAQPKRQRHVE